MRNSKVFFVIYQYLKALKLFLEVALRLRVDFG